MKSCMFLILVLLVLFVSFIGLSQVIIYPRQNPTNDWSLSDAQYASWIDTINTRVSRNSTGATFGFYGGTSFAAGGWGIQMNFSKLFIPSLSIPDSLCVDYSLVKITNNNNMIAICLYLGLADSVGEYGWYIQLGDDNEIPLNSNQKGRFYWSMDRVKKWLKGGIREFNLIFAIYTIDSCYTGAKVQCSNLSAVYNGSTRLIDFDTTGGTGVPESQVKVPKGFVLNQNYPNPFNPSTTINYSVPKTSFVTLKVYDVLGKEIVTLVNENKPVGIYSVNFNALNIPSGTYFYRLQTEATIVETKKMLFLK